MMRRDDSTSLLDESQGTRVGRGATLQYLYSKVTVEDVSHGLPSWVIDTLHVFCDTKAGGLMEGQHPLAVLPTLLNDDELDEWQQLNPQFPSLGPSQLID